MVQRIYGDKDKELLKIIGLVDLDEDSCKEKLDICLVLIDVASVEGEFDALLKLSDE